MWFLSLSLSASSTDLIGFSSVTQINDIVEREDLMWIATPGGLFSYNPQTEEQFHYRDLEDMPDLNIISMTLDSSGFIWAGTEKGYLYKIDKNGRVSRNSNYFASNWHINDIEIFGKYLLLGSNDGFSLFDTEEMKVIQSTSTIGTFSSPTINSIDVIVGSMKDSVETKNIKRIYLGMTDGYAWYDILNDTLHKENFFNSTIWDEKRDGNPVSKIILYSDSLISSNNEMVIHNGKFYYRLDNKVYQGEDVVIELDNEIKNGDKTVFYDNGPSVLYSGSKNLWVGSNFQSLFYLSDSGKHQVELEGLKFMTTNKVFVASDGTLWIMPNTGSPGAGTQTPNIGVSSYKDGAWRFYEKNKNNFGKLADYYDSFGMAEDKDGNMWFGFSGANVKKYDVKNSKWYRYEIAHDSRTHFKLLDNDNYGGWGKSDVLICDSLGYVWSGAWRSPDAGSLLCFDPSVVDHQEGDYKYFFPEASGYYQFNLLAMANDACGNIIIGGDASSGGGLIMFSYDGNPIKNGITTFEYGNNSFPKLSVVYDIASAPDSTSWVASGSGLFIYSNKKGENIDSRSFNDIATSGTINSIEIGGISRIYDSTYVTLWTSITEGGIIKSTVAYAKDEQGYIGGLRLVDDSVKVFNTESGLISNSINHITLDKNTGYLWAASNDGVIGIFDGNPFVQHTDSKQISIFPNPYIKSRHEKITFQHLAPEAQVMVYTLDGRIVANINESNSEHVKTGNEWTYYWTPSDKIKAGTYIYTGTTRGDKGYGKLLIIP